MSAINSNMSPEELSKVMPSEALTKARIITAHGFAWSYGRRNYQVDPNRRIQIRDDKTIHKPEVVKRYTSMIAGGAELPPPIVTTDGYLVDGNHTTAAYVKATLHTGYHLILEQMYDGATPEQVNRLSLLGHAENAANGMPPSKRDIRSHILLIASSLPREDYASDDAYYKAIATEVKVTRPRGVRGILLAEAARLRAVRLGEEHAAIKDTQWSLLGEPSVTNLSDLVFADLVRLVGEAQLSVVDTRHVIGQLNEDGMNDRQRRKLLDALLRAKNGANSNALKIIEVNMPLIKRYRDDTLDQYVEYDSRFHPTHLSALTELKDAIMDLWEKQIKSQDQ